MLEKTIQELYENSIIKREKEREAHVQKSRSVAKKHYDNHVKDIHALLDSISKGIEKSKPNDNEVHWGHVGDVSSIHSTLRDLHDRVHRTNEYGNGQEVVRNY